MTVLMRTDTALKVFGHGDMGEVLFEPWMMRRPFGTLATGTFRAAVAGHLRSAEPPHGQLPVECPVINQCLANDHRADSAENRHADASVAIAEKYGTPRSTSLMSIRPITPPRDSKRPSVTAGYVGKTDHLPEDRPTPGETGIGANVVSLGEWEEAARPQVCRTPDQPGQ